MDPISAGVAGLASLAGGFLQNQYNRENAQQAEAFAERMSSTAYQRSMADMQKAGLNPILAYQRGPASSPSGSMPTAIDMITPAVNSALSAGKMTQEVENLKATKTLAEQQQRLVGAQVDQSMSQTALNIANANVAGATEAKTKAETLGTLQALNIRAPEESAAKTTKSFEDSWIGRTLRLFSTGAGHVLPAVNSAAGVSRAVSPRGY